MVTKRLLWRILTISTAIFFFFIVSAEEILISKPRLLFSSQEVNIELDIEGWTLFAGRVEDERNISEIKNIGSPTLKNDKYYYPVVFRDEHGNVTIGIVIVSEPITAENYKDIDYKLIVMRKQ